MAAGTLIRRRKKRKEAMGRKDEWDDIPVEDIQPEDEILSLNEATGKFEWQMVEKDHEQRNTDQLRINYGKRKRIGNYGQSPVLSETI